MKKCPFCAEEIQDEAVKCKHCGEFLTKKVESLSKDEDIPKKDLTPAIVKKVAKVGIFKKSGFHYFVDLQGDISSVLLETRAFKKVAKVGIKRETGYFYFIDMQGDISSVERILIPNASQEIKDSYEWARAEDERTNKNVQAKHLSSTNEVSKLPEGIGNWIILIGFLFVCVVFVSSIFRSCSNSAPSTPENKPDVPDNISVCIGAEELVKGRLVSPGSAKFPDCNDQQIVSVGTNKWQVSSYVDSQNSFGGLMRSNYDIVVEYKGNDTFHLDEVREFTQNG